MKSKRMKQTLASLCAGAMIVSGMNFPVNVLSVDAAEQVQSKLQEELSTAANDSIVTVKGAKEIDSQILQENAKANSEQNAAQGNDGPASWAFDDQDHWWHSRWRGTAQSGEVSSGLVSENNKIWIQTGFGEAKKIKKVTYQARQDQSYGRINKYELQIANTENPTDSDFTTVKRGNLPNTNAVQTIELDEAMSATHIRLVVSSVHLNGGTAHVAAKRIRVYEEANVEYDMNKQADFWEYELANGSLAQQTAEDRWHYQIKENGAWSDLPESAYKANAGAWMNNGSHDATYNWAKLSKNEITSTLPEDSTKQAVGFAWKAKSKGYYQATLEKEMTNTGGSKLNFVVSHAKANDNGDGKVLLQEMLGNGQTFTSKIARVEEGDLIRIGATKHNAWVQNFLPMVVEVSAKDYAEQYLEEVANVEDGVESSQELKEAVVAARDALTTAVHKENPDMADIESKITALEQAIEDMKSYEKVENVTLNKNQLSLSVGSSEVLVATVTPETATNTKVQWSSNSEDVTVDKNGKVVGVKKGSAVITAQSVDNPDVKATCTVTVTRDDTKLEAAIAEAEKIMSEEDYANKYTDASKKTLTDALDVAEGARNDLTATQGEVNEATNNLNDAIANMEAKFAVTVKNGDVTDKKYYESGEEVTVVAKPASEGQKFAYWAVNGNPISYKETYTFTVLADMVVEARYVEKDEVVEQQATIMCTSYYDKEVGKVVFTAKRSVPTGCKVVEHGIIITDSTGWNALGDTGFVIGAERTVKSTGKTTGLLGNYTCRMKSASGTTWYGRGYVKYVDKSGKIHTLYSEITSCEAD